MNQSQLPRLFETAARASINQRCAAAFLHDVRGTMQALFSAFELLGRSARSGTVDLSRVEKACDLARRAIQRHEKSTLDVLQRLTLQQTEPKTVDLGVLIEEVTHFVRNEAATKHVTLVVTTAADLTVLVDLPKLHTLLVGLLTAAIDATPEGVQLPLSLVRDGNAALLCIGSHGDFSGAGDLGETGNLSETRDEDQFFERGFKNLHPRELTLLFAHQYLKANEGRLHIDSQRLPHGALHLYLPTSGAN